MQQDSRAVDHPEVMKSVHMQVDDSNIELEVCKCQHICKNQGNHHVIMNVLDLQDAVGED